MKRRFDDAEITEVAKRGRKGAYVPVPIGFGAIRGAYHQSYRFCRPEGGMALRGGTGQGAGAAMEWSRGAELEVRPRPPRPAPLLARRPANGSLRPLGALLWVMRRGG